MYVTTIVVALNAIVMVFFAILGPSSSAIASALIFSKGAILQDWKLWTLVTYAFVDSINFFSALGLVFFYLFGLRVEQRLGTHRYLKLLGLLILGPTVLLTMIGLFMSGTSGDALAYVSFNNVQLGVLITFIWLNSDALFWPGVKAKWFGAFIVALATLQYLNVRLWVAFWMAWFSLLLAYIFLRRNGMEMKFAGVEESILNLIPSRKSKGYRSSKRKLKVVKQSGGGRKVAYESKLAPKVSTTASSAPVASIDHLLDKISKQGISSLSETEREQLKNASDRLSGNDSTSS